jgi:hypothetical protein
MTLYAFLRWIASLSEFANEIKVGFARYYNKRHNRVAIFEATGLKVSSLTKERPQSATTSSWGYEAGPSKGPGLRSAGGR